MDDVSILDEVPDGTRVEVACERCGRSFGRYEAERGAGAEILLYLDDRGLTRALRPEDARRPRVRGPRTGRRRALIEHGPDGVPRLRFRCGCGRDVYRRLDRLGSLPVTWSRARRVFVVVL